MVKLECVYWKDKIGGETAILETEAFSYGFTFGPHGEWEMAIAKEDKEVKKSEPVSIKIHEIEVPPKAIALPCIVMRHALGIIAALALVGKPKIVEERRVFDEVIFLPISDGVVHKGELLGVVNVFYAAIERRLARGAAEKWLMERLRF
ncbi:MAG: DUF22 domain-containing protein [Methanophagales archaeon ANME-1-THS]|nr:MAG: DUF22 domain-containing protein [Methanophagales archaeon ANME-1-THS]